MKYLMLLFLVSCGPGLTPPKVPAETIAVDTAPTPDPSPTASATPIECKVIVVKCPPRFVAQRAEDEVTCVKAVKGAKDE